MKRKTTFLAKAFLMLFAVLCSFTGARAQSELFSENFEGGEMPTGWTTDGPGTWTIGTGDYSASTGAGQGTYNAFIKHGTTGNATKLITPEIDLSSTTSAVLSFMHIQRSWTGDTDELRVYYRTSSEGEWTILLEYTDAVGTWTKEEDIALPELSSTYQIAFEMTDKYGYGVGIDDVSIGIPASIAKPTDLKASTIFGDATKAILSWTENGTATAWQICLNEDEANLIPADSNPFTLTGLTPETVYTAKVRAVVGEEYSNWSNTVTFEPTVKTVIGSGSVTNNYLPTYPYYNYSLTQQIYTTEEIGAATGKAIESIDFFAQNGLTRNLDIYMVSTDKESFESETDWVPVTAGDLVFSGEVTFAANAWTTITLDDEFVLTGKNVVLVVDDNTGSWISAVPFLAFDATAQAIRVYADDTDYDPTNPSSYSGTVLNVKNQIRLAIGEVSGLPKPSGLKVSNIGPRSADLSWAENGEATAWEICLSGDETNLIPADSDPFTLTGLTPETTYTAKVRATNGTEFSKWSNEVSFTTDIAYPAPTDVAASDITSNSATITWGGAADSYNLRYRAAKGFNYDFESAEAFAVDAFSPCTTYDGDGLPTYGIQNYDMPNANYVGSVIAFSDNDQWAAHSGNTMGAFMDAIPDTDAGITANDDYFITPELTIASGDHFSFWARSVTANYGLERIKVGVYGGNGTFSSYLAGSATTYVEVPVEWTQYDYDLTDYAGQTIQLAINCVSADAFALLFDDLFVGDPTDDTWDVTLTDVTSPYVLNGLSNETKYEVQVQSVYTGEDSGESVWVGTDFRTLTNNPVPYDIEADLAADGATFTWTGEGDSYNVQYRTAESRDTYYFNDFNSQDTEGWTRDYFIYGFTDPIYDVAGDDNYFLELGWNSTDEEIIISSELPEYESGAHVEFYYFGYSTANTFQVGFSTTTNDADAFTWSSPIEAPLQTYTLYNEELADGVKYVAFKATASEQGASIFIDDFGIFSPTIPASEWQTIVAEEATATISGLATNALYEYQIQSVKGENESNWTNVGEFALVTLDGNGENTNLINQFDGKYAHVTLNNHTLYKDGTWNTFCLPFDLDPDQFAASPLAGGDVRLFTGSTVDGDNVTLNFTEEGEAEGYYSAYGYPGYVGGMPYIVKWASASNIVNPAFANVTISSVRYSSGDDGTGSVTVQMAGLYDSYQFTADDTSILFIGADNKLNYPLAGATIGAFRGYFTLDGVSANESESGVKIFTNLDDEDPTGITNIENGADNGDWYDLSGRKLAGKPVQKGIYVNGGRKVTIK